MRFSRKLWAITWKKAYLQYGLISGLTFSLLASAIYADSLKVEPSATEIELSENLSLDFIVTSDSMSARIGDPGFLAPDFEQVNVYQRGTSIQSVYENGNFTVKRTETISVVLHPKKTGALKVKDLKILINNKMVQHPDLTITVYEDGKLPSGSKQGHLFGGARQRSGTGLQAPLPKSGLGVSRQDIAKSVIIRTEPDKLKVYKGQFIRLKYNLYSRAQIANIQVERFPTATGFLKEDIDVPILKGPQNLDWSRVVYNGMEYRRGTLAEYALFPVREGILPLDVFSAKISFRGRSALGGLGDDDDDPLSLNRFFQAFQLLTETIVSDRRSIEVLPLPTETQPKDFSGLVGSFSVDVLTDKTTVRTGEPLQVRVRIAGEGHPGSLEKLQISWPESFELYEDRSFTKFDVSGRSERVFEYLLIPRKVGGYSIPAVQIWMFDPESKSYVLRQTNPVSIQVEQGSTSNSNISLNSSQRSSALMSSKGSSLDQNKTPQAEIFKSSELGPVVNQSLTPKFRKYLAIPLVLFALVNIFLIYFHPTQIHDRWVKQKLKKQSAPFRRIKELDRLIDANKTSDFLAALDAGVTKVILDRYGVARSSMTTNELLAALQEKGTEESMVRRIESICKDLERLRFAVTQDGLSPNQLKSILQIFKSIVEA